MFLTQLLLSVFVSLSASAKPGDLILGAEPENPVKNVFFGSFDRVSGAVTIEAKGKTREEAIEKAEKSRQEVLEQQKAADARLSGQGRPNIFISVLNQEAHAVSPLRHIMETSDGVTVVDRFTIQSSGVVLSSRATDLSKGQATLAMIMAVTADGLKTVEQNYNISALVLGAKGSKLTLKAGPYVREQVASQLTQEESKKIKIRMVLAGVGDETNHVILNLNEKDSAEFMNFSNQPKRNLLSRALTYCASLVVGSR